MNSNLKPDVIPEEELRRSQVAVLLERHLSSEVQLLSQLEELNRTLSDALSGSGASGLTYEQSILLGEASDALMQSAEEIRGNRKKMLAMIGDGFPTDRPASIRLFIQTLTEPTRTRLESIRFQLLDRLTDVHASMLGNQAVMFYTYDFNRKMVEGLLGTEKEDGNYGVDGQSAGIKPGNLIQRAC
jgi:hypothetical protein